MAMVKLKIDGRDVSAPSGSTILQAAKNAGIKIPTLCFHERMKPLGTCGICVVEIDGNSTPCVVLFRRLSRARHVGHNQFGSHQSASGRKP